LRLSRCQHVAYAARLRDRVAIEDEVVARTTLHRSPQSNIVSGGKADIRCEPDQLNVRIARKARSDAASVVDNDHLDGDACVIILRDQTLNATRNELKLALLPVENACVNDCGGLVLQERCCPNRIPILNPAAFVSSYTSMYGSQWARLLRTKYAD